MRTLLLSGLACASFALSPSDVCAHGGQYRGPGDTVQPPTGGGGGTTPGPSGPTTPGGSGPSTPGPGEPSTPTGGEPSTPSGGPGMRGGPTTPRGIDVGDDLTRWQFWWEFNKDPFIRLKDAIHRGGIMTGSDVPYMGHGAVGESTDTMRPTDAQVMHEIVPKLKQALDGTDQRDITSSCMVALAKIGKHHETFDILDVAAALGISQMVEAVDDLIALTLDEPRGRELTARAEVDDHTRSFAAYGLGLIAHATSDVDVKRRVFEAVAPILADETISDRNIRVAVINTIALLRPTDDENGKQLLHDACAALETYWNREAKLLNACDDAGLRAKFVAEFVDTLRSPR
jgi:hypothetical protein